MPSHCSSACDCKDPDAIENQGGEDDEDDDDEDDRKSEESGSDEEGQYKTSTWRYWGFQIRVRAKTGFCYVGTDLSLLVNFGNKWRDYEKNVKNITLKSMAMYALVFLVDLGSPAKSSYFCYILLR